MIQFVTGDNYVSPCKGPVEYEIVMIYRALISCVGQSILTLMFRVRVHGSSASQAYKPQTIHEAAEVELSGQ